MLQLLHDTISGYEQEAIPILFYPTGFRYRARYKIKHVETSIVADSTNCEGKRAIVCLRYKSATQQWPKGDRWPDDVPMAAAVAEWRAKSRIIPMRYATIVGIEKLGDIVTVEYALDRYYRHPSTTPDRLIDHSISFNSELEAIGGTPPESRPLMAKMDKALLAKYEKVDKTDDAAWQTLVGMFSLIGSLRISPFVRLRTVIEVGSLRKLKWLDTFGAAPVLSLHAGRTYELSFVDAFPGEFFNIDHDVPAVKGNPRKYKLVVDRCFSLAGARKLAIGDYDFFRFVIQVHDAAEGRNGEITLNQSIPDAMRKRMSLPLDYEVPSNFRRNRTRAIAFGLALFVERVLTSSSTVNAIVKQTYSAADQQAVAVMLQGWIWQLAQIAFDGILLVLFIFYATEAIVSSRRHKE